MRRREFLAVTAATAALGLTETAKTTARAATSAQAARQLIDLRIYHFASPEKQQAYEKFLAEAAIGAFNRAGVEPVGVFKLLSKDNAALRLTADSTDLYVILPHKTADSFARLESRLAADEAFKSAGAAILTAPKANPAFTRCESTLLLAFEMFPEVQVPTKAATRLTQLRIYESHNTEKARLKIQMFNQGGELAVFKKSGMTGVFFGEALAGPNLPKLCYMLSFEDEQKQTKAWADFGADPDWRKLSGDATYRDTVSTITNLILRPCSGSQV